MLWGKFALRFAHGDDSGGEGSGGGGGGGGRVVEVVEIGKLVCKCQVVAGPGGCKWKRCRTGNSDGRDDTVLDEKD